MVRSAQRGKKSRPTTGFEASLRRALEFVEVERPRLVRAVRPFGLSPADLDDVVQVAITELALSWNDKLARLSIREVYACVLRTAHLRALDAVRREKRRLQREERFRSDPPESPIDPEKTVLRKRERAAYWAALRRLPLGLLQPLLLAIEGDMTSEQIAATLGLPVGTVKSRLRKARALCRTPEWSRAPGEPRRRSGRKGTAA